MLKFTDTKKNIDIKIDPKVWKAFLAASSFAIDSGDLYVYLSDDFSKKTLKKVQDLKTKLDYL